MKGEGEPSHLESVLSLMQRFREGDSGAAGALVEELYADLRQLAAAKLVREPAGHSWQPTQLVHELYLELARFQGLPYLNGAETHNAEREKATFLRLAGIMMQRRLIDHAKPRYRKMPVLDASVLEATESQDSAYDSLLYVEHLLNTLSGIDPKFRTVVEGRVFLGMTLSEIGDDLRCTERTAATYWSFARQWLAEELDKGYSMASP